ncbi:beta-lactamase-like protein [Phlyctochytrium arcticum]|nr:beta-lactamase-like protein [Phlyctochytrium arcticum]
MSVGQHPTFSKESVPLILAAKERGTAAYKSEQYQVATAEYSKAISLFSSSPHPPPPIDEHAKLSPQVLLGTLYSNRSASYFREKKFDEALKDANTAVLLRPNWSKGYFRKGEVYRAMKQHQDALVAYEAAFQRDSSDRIIIDKLMRIKILLDDAGQGFAIHQLAPGTDLCQKSFMTPIQNMIFEYAVQMRNFIYIIENVASKECLVVDACWDIDGIIKYAQKKGLKIVGALVTHYHIDHVGGIPPAPFDKYRVRVDGLAKLLKKLPNIQAFVNPADVPGIVTQNPEISTSRFEFTEDHGTLCLPLALNGPSLSNDHVDENTNDGTTTIIQFIHTPGHTPGSQCLLVNGCRLLSGDTLFISACGRVDFPDSDKDLMYDSLKKLSQLPINVIVYPGHSYGGDMTTIEKERISGLLAPKTKADFYRHVSG